MKLARVGAQLHASVLRHALHLCGKLPELLKPGKPTPGLHGMTVVYSLHEPAAAVRRREASKVAIDSSLAVDQMDRRNFLTDLLKPPATNLIPFPPGAGSGPGL
ncbi:MAG: hypothetical protein CFE30_26730 [Bradyrhizobium sp. PARBB1]|jgi:hypothetical protein|nr:MAG: hypothetical protein CFE30_26730 [Bradyrhizobium sp. PARBB1]PSO26636.1 hypothetical protein C7G43_11190 [Bradyrhizobium sp. MOS004]